tara:strand:+ start:418 stop:777 length:360 start_codon:yes stop_codon:yes gene_type:complete
MLPKSSKYLPSPIESVQEHSGMTDEEFYRLDEETQENLVWKYLTSPAYKDTVIANNADLIMGLRQDKEHLEMEIDMLKENIYTLCNEVQAYRSIWVVKLYRWLTNKPVLQCEELMSGRW